MCHCGWGEDVTFPSCWLLQVEAWRQKNSGAGHWGGRGEEGPVHPGLVPVGRTPSRQKGALLSMPGLYSMHNWYKGPPGGWGPRVPAIISEWRDPGTKEDSPSWGRGYSSISLHSYPRIQPDPTDPLLAWFPNYS
jgi:hypothetical protein